MVKQGFPNIGAPLLPMAWVPLLRTPTHRQAHLLPSQARALSTCPPAVASAHTMTPAPAASCSRASEFPQHEWILG